MWHENTLSFPFFHTNFSIPTKYMKDTQKNNQSQGNLSALLTLHISDWSMAVSFRSHVYRHIPWFSDFELVREYSLLFFGVVFYLWMFGASWYCWIHSPNKAYSKILPEDALYNAMLFQNGYIYIYILMGSGVVGNWPSMCLSVLIKRSSNRAYELPSFLIVLNAYLKWSTMIQASTPITMVAIDCLFFHFGVPETNNKLNNSQFCLRMDMHHWLSLVYRPQSNGKPELFVNTFKRVL